MIARAKPSMTTEVRVLGDLGIASQTGDPGVARKSGIAGTTMAELVVATAQGLAR